MDFRRTIETQATTGHPAGTDEQRLMVQQLLAERFGLRVHRESRKIPVYFLIGGKNGAKIETAKEGGDPGQRGTNIVSGVMIARDGTMADFVGVLTANLDQPVLDRTEVGGRYDFTATWDPPTATTNGPS